MSAKPLRRLGFLTIGLFDEDDPRRPQVHTGHHRARRTAARPCGVPGVDEVAFALPFTFAHDDYVQILTDIATRLGPELGWQPW